jgi:hypothetical protein
MLASLGVQNNLIAVLGGYDGTSNKFNDVWTTSDVNNAQVWNAVSLSCPWSPRDMMGAVAFPSGRIVILGGSGPGLTFLGDVWTSSVGSCSPGDTSCVGACPAGTYVGNEYCVACAIGMMILLTIVE